tara:strand:+ start:671 stop:973 length:303 start_codon:yes stop_codon:yes gene_type:complete
VIDLAFFVLCSFGLTQILLFGSIFDDIRPTNGTIGKLFRCPMCMGFWTGLFLWGINDTTELFSFDPSPATGLLLGFLSSGTCYVLSMLVDDYGFKVSRGE